MDILDAFSNTVVDGGGPTVVGPRMGMSAQVLRNKADRDCTTNKPLLVDADKIMAITKNYQILDALAANHGRIVIRAPEPGESCDAAILELMAHNWKSNGEVGMTIHEVLSDGRVKKEEIPKVRSAIYRAMQSLNETLVRLEGMAE